MDDAVFTLVRDLGTAGILGLSLFFVVRAITPLVTMLADAQKQQADARREQTEASKAVIKRWEESDHVLDRIGQSTVEALTAVRDEIHDLKVTDSQRIKQNDITAAQVAGTRDDIRKLATDFVAGKDDAVKQVGRAMDEKLKPIEQALQMVGNQLSDAQRDIADALALLRAMEAKPAQPTQEHHHTGSVEIVPKAEPADEAEDKSA